MTMDPRIPTTPRRSTSGFHQPGRYCLHQARSAVRCSASVCVCGGTHLLLVIFVILAIDHGSLFRDGAPIPLLQETPPSIWALLTLLPCVALKNKILVVFVSFLLEVHHFFLKTCPFEPRNGFGKQTKMPLLDEQCHGLRTRRKSCKKKWPISDEFWLRSAAPFRNHFRRKMPPLS